MPARRSRSASRVPIFGGMEAPAPLSVRVQLVGLFALLAVLALFYETVERLLALARLDVRTALRVPTFAALWQRHAYARVAQCWTHVTTTSAAARDATIDGRTRTLNMGSYNYLGLEGASASARACVRALASASSAPERDAVGEQWAGEFEREMAAYLGHEACAAFASGFGTNVVALGGACGSRDALVLADERAHASLVAARRIVGARLAVFGHNDMGALEALLARHGGGVPIVVVVEGLYSMDADCADMDALAALKRRFAFDLYVDEAHSLGALDICAGVAPVPVPPLIDYRVGTLSKAFASCGGFVCGSRAAVRRVRAYAVDRERRLPAPLAAHALHVLRALRADASLRARLVENTLALRAGLRACGLRVLGRGDAPVVPVLVYHPARLVALQQRLAERHGIAVTVVGYPATSVLACRARLCVSAAHTRSDIERVVRAMGAIGRELGLNYDSR